VIRIDRRAVPEPPSLADHGVREREAVIAFYADPCNGERPYSFRAYKSQDVVAALNKLFHGKCAYCESRYRATAPTDVEHFRPKGAVMIEHDGSSPTRSQRGYYWLAAHWDNLLPSCIDCNRARTQEFPDDDRTVVRGKENRFPLVNERYRAVNPGEEASLERGRRLLLHPCRDHPKRHIEFNASGLIRARRGSRSVSRKGRVTIDVLGLRRKGLKEERRAHLLLLAERMQETLYFIEGLDTNPEDHRLVRELEMRLKRLRRLTGDSQLYAGMTRQFVGDFEASLRNRNVRAFMHTMMKEVTGGEH
jgi:uncharacterized protein (TIGR02646 family)